ncbi:MAG TPA: serine hydrolase domain-containing protein, partial [Gammaproteobacteria bacterium]|nr:serine hydrolase domain-containing protein [Gammaproteobacteria bacterium]
MQQIPVEQLRERLPEFVARIHTETKVPGIAVAVSVGGERVYAQAGTRNVDDSLPLTTDDRFHLGCATKLLLAVVTLELARSGRLDLNATIAEYLPELENTLHGNTIRLAHLLSHTSGYRGTNILEPETRELTWDAFVEYLRHTPQFFAPGSVFNYEHTEAVLLGEIIRRATDKTTLTLIREMVFEPLGISPGLFETDARGAGRHDLDPTSGRFKRLDHVPPLTEFWLSAFSNYTLSLVDLVTIAESAIGVGLSRSSSTSPVSNATLNLLQRPVVWLPPTAGGPLRELLP